MRPKKEEHPEYYNYYVDLVKQEDVVNALTETKKTSSDFIKNIPIELANYAYADGKWTTKQVLIHCIDTERITATRALRFARGDSQKSTSFDENLYAAAGQFNKRSLYDLLHEFSLSRESNIALFKSFDEETLNSMGSANNNRMSVRAILFMIAGHEKHHVNVIKERYLTQIPL